MERLYHRILGFLGINGRELAVLLLALLLAFSIWLIHNLSLRYNDYLNASVVARCNIEGHSDVSANRCDVMARCRTTGYNVLRHSLKGKTRPVEIDFSRAVMKRKDDDIFYITSSDLMEYAHLIYGDDVSVEYFVSDTLFFRFPVMDHKKVPVSARYSITYDKQYMGNGNMELEPDSVIVYGSPFLLENIQMVYTKPIRHNDLSENVQGIISLDSVKGVRLSVSQVRYSLDVTRFVEFRDRLPVNVAGLPKEKEMIVLPSVVDVTLKCAFPLIGEPFEDISLYVDYDEYMSSISGRCVVRTAPLPRGVISCDIDPVAVECVIEDK